ncbi:hypothetical protein DC522_23930 [Microvirga sp. KLBC 81]|uniref:hypothetical protein n=1 Tax=Microvirga sp. KLBC 81 TaxID=1862707 RepID=UPI000D510588|nr:hypothetical protein [Microvirga sp. KLBC 81]PVE21916.1 hypothetical protein DC522_23930 [Microvirga sp. KLBC 81]
MPRDRQRLTLESGPKLDLAKLIPSGAGRPGSHIQCVLTYGSGETITAILKLSGYGGLLELSFQGRQQAFSLVSEPRHFGGLQWYVICPRTGRQVRVLYRPLGATAFASRHAWGRRSAYTSQFLDPIGRAWRTKAKVKAALLGDADPDEWDLPPKPKGMRWATYEQWVERYDAAEEILDAQLVLAAARLMKRF